MTVVVDASVVLAAYDVDDADHDRVRRWYEALEEDLVTTPLLVAEIDERVRLGGGEAAAAGFRDDLDSGALQVRWWSTAMAETVAIARKQPQLGLPEASLLALAPVVRTTRIATLHPDRFATTGLTLLP